MSIHVSVYCDRNLRHTLPLPSDIILLSIPTSQSSPWDVPNPLSLCPFKTSFCTLENFSAFEICVLQGSLSKEWAGGLQVRLDDGIEVRAGSWDNVEKIELSKPGERPCEQ